MLTDIFANRYGARQIWTTFGDSERRLLIQSFQLISEEVAPYYASEGKPGNKPTWESAVARLKRELGVNDLAPAGFFHAGPTGNSTWIALDLHTVCKTFMCNQQPPSPEASDRHMKERLSLVELIFRARGFEIALTNARLPRDIADAQARRQRRQGIVIQGDPAVGLTMMNQQMNTQFELWVTEINERFRRAAAPLRLHNGYIQLALDETAESQISNPFWRAVAGDTWQNVRHDMSEAVDLRDTNGRDPAFYAARALESAIKIISDQQGWTKGTERGAFNFLDNLGRNGFITEWEKESLQTIFRSVRNPLSHGPGAGEMPNLTEHQTNWAIESCMSWVKSLVSRLPAHLMFNR